MVYSAPWSNRCFHTPSLFSPQAVSTLDPLRSLPNHYCILTCDSLSMQSRYGSGHRISQPRGQGKKRPALRANLQAGGVERIAGGRAKLINKVPLVQCLPPVFLSQKQLAAEEGSGHELNVCRRVCWVGGGASCLFLCYHMLDTCAHDSLQGALIR